MVKTFKNIGFVFIVLLLTAGFYWLIFIDRASKQDTLEYAMGLLGNKLLAMIPENADKQTVEARYEELIKHTKDNKLTPEQIESVAANIINISNIDTTITPEQALAILDVSLSPPAKIEHIDEKGVERVVRFTVPSPPPAPPKRPDNFRMPPHDWHALGKKIKTVCEFNDEMQGEFRKHAEKANQEQIRMKYRIDKDLKVVMDQKLQHKLKSREFRKLSKEIRRVEKERMFEWRKDFEQELEKEMQKLEHELESLDELKELQDLDDLQIDMDKLNYELGNLNIELEKLDHLKGNLNIELDSLHMELKNIEKLKALKSLEALNSLKDLHYMPVVEPDSIRIIIEKSLKEAGKKE